MEEFWLENVELAAPQVVRVAVGNTVHRALVSQAIGWNHLMDVAREILGQPSDETLTHALTGYMVLDAAGQGHGTASIARIIEKLLQDPKKLGAPNSGGISSRCKLTLTDANAPWRFVLLGRLLLCETPEPASAQLPWLDRHAWLYTLESELANPSSDRAQLRQLLQRDIPNSGFFRQIVSPPSPGAVEALADEFPNFQPATEHIAAQVSIAHLGNAPLRLPPLLLLGDAGIGKTVFALRAGEIFGVRVNQIALSHATISATLGGASTFWSTANAGQVFDGLLRGRELNPFFLLDEIDKVSPDLPYNPLGPLYTLLEAETARSFVDEFVNFPIDASWLTWIGTANELSGIPAPILSRFATFEIRQPTRTELREIGRRQYRRLVTQFGLTSHLPNEPPLALLDQVEVSPRELRILVQSAIGRMARNLMLGRKATLEQPLVPMSRLSHRRVGFVT